jgi:hypothetical protein
VALDVLRGIALFGVLLVNLETLFRVSLFEHMLTFHTHSGRLNGLVDVLVAGLLEFKAFSLFSLMFGIGVAIQAERAAARGVNVTRFLVRRFVAHQSRHECHYAVRRRGANGTDQLSDAVRSARNHFLRLRFRVVRAHRAGAGSVDRHCHLRRTTVLQPYVVPPLPLRSG